ncbi:hypothetical protein D3C86_757320 [compost metagenome]
MRKQRERDALKAETNAGGMGDIAIVEVKTPFLAEGILVIVEAHAGRRAGRRCDRDQQFEFQVLVALVVGQHLAGTAEERIVGDIDGDVEPDCFHHLDAAIHPGLAEFGDVGLGTHANIFAHAEKLLAGRILGGFMRKQ